MKNTSFAFQLLNVKNLLMQKIVLISQMQNECDVLIFQIDDKEPNEKLKTMLVLSPFRMKSFNKQRVTFHSETNQRLKTKNMFLRKKIEIFLTDREAK